MRLQLHPETPIKVAGLFEVPDRVEEAVEGLAFKRGADARVPLLRLHPVDRSVLEMIRVDAPFLAVGLDADGFGGPPFGPVAIVGADADELDEMRGFVFDGVDAELKATLLNLPGELLAVGQSVGVLIEPCLALLDGLGELVALVGETIDERTVLAPEAGQPARSSVLDRTIELELDLSQPVGVIPWGVFGDPGVEVRQPGREYGEGLTLFERVAEMLERGVLGHWAGQRHDEHVTRTHRLFRVVAVGVEVVGDHERGVVVPAAGHGHIQRLGGEVVVGDDDPVVDGDALSLVDGEGVAERHVLV